MNICGAQESILTHQLQETIHITSLLYIPLCYIIFVICALLAYFLHFRIYARLCISESNCKVKHMSETLVVSSRGQITLPATLRKRLGIRSGDVVILEERGNEVVLKPGIVLEVQHYSDEQIAEWDAEDKLSDQERSQLVGMLATAKK
jgi:antitoxin PrlF